MCGIAGFLAKGTERPGRELLATMGGTLAHRGPDGSGEWLSPDGRAGLAHRRLAILDLTPAGAQPMTTADGRFAISFNGEVFNYREIRSELKGLGHAFRSDSDTEVMLAAIAEWGLDAAVSRFIGMFAFALWDEQKGTLSLVRDRLGIKPLYLAHAPGLTLFSSELKGIMACPAFSREVDRDALQYFLEFQYVPIPFSIFRDARKVPPGVIVEIGPDGSRAERRYWDLLDHWGVSGAPRREEEYLDELKGLLSSSIRYRMISDVPLGAFLSGGIDSSLVVALMQRESSRPVKTFSIGFDEKGYDESGYARAVANHLGTEHHAKICTASEALSLIRKIPEHYDEPFADSSAIPTMLVSSFTREHVTVSLSGDGGDELFCGYPRYDWVRQGSRAHRLPAPIRKPLAALLSRVPSHRVQKAAASLREGDLARFYFHAVAIVGHDLLPDLLAHVADDSGLGYFSTFRDPRLSNPLDRAMATDIRTYLVDDILTKVDRASMACSLEARVPLLDHRIVEFAARLPLSMKVGAFGAKHLLRRVLYDLVPRELLERPKMGFGIPVDRWLRNELRPLVEEHLSPERIRKEGFLRPEGVSRLVDEHMSGRTNHMYRIWALLMFSMWRERWLG
ncbi:MAG TPA: asparagine synthase (glutamine-hydrolyzing) [Candidatus Deferrimicrobiaceae bacterium]|jgi:asparagine synthase (glutamine-hydrolysing)